MKYCRYENNKDVSSCSGCEKGCLDKKPPAYINKDFEVAVNDMAKGGYPIND